MIEIESEKNDEIGKISNVRGNLKAKEKGTNR